MMSSEIMSCSITPQNRSAAAAHIKSVATLAGVSESLAQSLYEEVAFLTTKRGKEKRRKSQKTRNNYYIKIDYNTVCSINCGRAGRLVSFVRMSPSFEMFLLFLTKSARLQKD